MMEWRERIIGCVLILLILGAFEIGWQLASLSSQHWAEWVVVRLHP